MSNKLVSVVVPVLNEEKWLESTLQSIKSQSFKNYEIIVVDNGSIDNSPEIAKKYTNKVFFEERRGPLFAMHKGFTMAKGKIITVCDADTIYPENWLMKMVDKLKSDKIVAVYGPMAFREDGRIRQLLVIWGYSIFNALSNIFGVSLCGAANFGMKRKAYNQVGGYMLESKVASQDFILAKKLKKIGKVKFIPSMICYTSNRRYTRVNFMHGIKEAFKLWLDVALNRNKITYDDYYDSNYYNKK